MELPVSVNAAGAVGEAMIVTPADGEDWHPAAFVTRNVYVLDARPEIVKLEPEPLIVAPPGARVTVQLPAGRPFRTTEPVGFSHVGCVTVPIDGAVGTVTLLIVTSADCTEVQPPAFVTVKWY